MWGKSPDQRLFRPVDDGMPGTTYLDADFIGPSLRSYRYGDHLWGLPLDAACQVSCARPDLMGQLISAPPADWSQVLELGEKALRKNLRLAMSFAGLHSLMTMLI